MKELLNNLERTLKEINAPVLDLLIPGENRVVNDMPKLTFPPEMEILYAWKNGTNIQTKPPLGKIWLFYLGIFLEFSIAKEVYELNCKELPAWDKSKFPLFESGGGEFYLLECDMESSEYGMIFFHSIGDIDIDVIISKFDSIESWVKTTLECYTSGCYWIDKENSFFKCDLRKELLIGIKHNPKSKFWKMKKDDIDNAINNGWI
jgi:hypothetical protein